MTASVSQDLAWARGTPRDSVFTVVEGGAIEVCIARSLHLVKCDMLIQKIDFVGVTKLTKFGMESHGLGREIGNRDT